MNLGSLISSDLSAVNSFFKYPPTTESYTLSLHDALPISHLQSYPLYIYEQLPTGHSTQATEGPPKGPLRLRSEEHTSELQSHSDLVCRLLLEKKTKCALSTVRYLPLSCRMDWNFVSRPRY